MNRLEKVCRGVAYGGIALAGVSLAKFVTDVYYNITTGYHDINENAIYGAGVGVVVSALAATIGNISYTERTREGSKKQHYHGTGGS